VSFFRGEKGTDGYELAEGIGGEGGQPESNTRARRSLAADQPCESPLGTTRDAMLAGGGSQPEERHVMASEVLKIDRRRKENRHGGFSNTYPTSFEERLLDMRVRTPPPSCSVLNYRRAASCSVLLAITTAHCSQRRSPDNVLNHRGRVRAGSTRSNRYWKTDGDGPGTRENLARGHERQIDKVSSYGLPFLPRSRRGREFYARRRAATGGAASISDMSVRGSRRDRRRRERGFFSIPPPTPPSGTTAVAYQHRPDRPVPTIAG
jgi:hypothetical protein